jgi:pSer/pThr/pTyr-binding forkhead associated (FHA) protein
MDARLKVLFGQLSGQTIPVPVGEMIVGRHEDCRLGALSDFVSRRHCALVLDQDTLTIRDLGSKNGTLVNGSRVGPTETALRHGDIISVGDLVAQIELFSPKPVVPAAVIDADPAASSAALMGTGVFDGDTMEAKDPRGNPSQIAPPDRARGA